MLKIEEIKNTEKILLIYEEKDLLLEKIKKHFESYGFLIHVSPQINEKNIHYYKYIIIFDKKNDLETLLKNYELVKIKKTKVLYLIENNRKKLELIKKQIDKNYLKLIKVINIDKRELSKENLEKLYWFYFSNSPNKVLDLEKTISKVPTKTSFIPFKEINFSFKKFLLILIILFILIEVIFIPPFLITGFYTYKSYESLKTKNIELTKNYLDNAQYYLQVTKNLYKFSRPSLSIFYLALLPDNMISFEETSIRLIETGVSSIENGSNVIELFFKKNKSQEEIDELKIRLEKINLQLNTLQEEISTLRQLTIIDFNFFSKYKQKLIDADKIISQIKNFYNYNEEIFATEKTKKFLFLFQNNMEIRPGGGFIGSFGILEITNYTLNDLKIYDVYDADGQLKAHIEPPYAIRKYLNQPHWFLRDSNFSPDFSENAQKAQSFIEKEININQFDGTIAITTTAIKNILEAYGEIYLPDYKESINKENFYIKTQLHSEKNFFPGSTQKKTYLSSLVRNMLININDVSYDKLIKSIFLSLDEKQMVLNFQNSQLQNTVEKYGWSGKIVLPKCATNSDNCLIDFLFPVDANLGVNKANFFVTRSIYKKIKIDTDGTIKNYVNFVFQNDSPLAVFPGGIYKNYFQILIPKNSKIINITKDNSTIEDYQKIDNDYYDIYGFYFEIKPKQSSEIKINYELENKIKKGKGVYQLTIQKQIGSPNNDLILEIDLPDNFYTINQNFSAIAKDGSLVYNTNLSNDKIFFIELIKE